MQKPKIIKPDNVVYAIHKYDSLDSTNTYLKEQYENLPDYIVIWAEEQTEGKGRFTRKWDSILGKDLTFSVLLPLNALNRSMWPNITQITALAVAELLEEYGLTSSIKWPNDVLVEQKKICGILCETVERNKRSCAVLGIGLNVNSTSETLSHIAQPATSLYNELHHTVPRDEILKKLVEKIILLFSELAQNGFVPFHEKIRRRLAYTNEEKILSDGTKKYTGRILDINKNGTLLFRCNDGTIVTLHSGELSFS